MNGQHQHQHQQDDYSKIQYHDGTQLCMKCSHGDWKNRQSIKAIIFHITVNIFDSALILYDLGDNIVTAPRVLVQTVTSIMADNRGLYPNVVQEQLCLY